MELPDMEKAKRRLARARLYHSSIKKTSIQDRKVVHGISPKKLKGQRITKFRRKGKYLVMELEKGSLLFHGGMTGKFGVFPNSEELEHVVLELTLSNGKHFFFQDSRRFGECFYSENWREELSDLGIDPLKNEFTYKNFKNALHGSKSSIKPFLQKQSHIAGMGNIYIDEALWKAKVHPEAKINELNEPDLKSLFDSIPKVCRWAVNHLKPPVATSKQAIGEQLDFLKVYGRSGEKCLRCNAKIIKKYVSQRVTYYCSSCQKK